MVDFRYHLVSIIAVFLALAVGIVLGTTTINGPVLDSLNRRMDSLSTDRDALRAENKLLTERIAEEDDFAEAMLPLAVAGRLTGESIVIVSAADAPAETRDGAARAFVTAGATIAGRVQLTPKFTDPQQAGVLQRVVEQIVGGTPSDPGTPLQHAANQLAIALAGKTRDGSTGGNAETDRVVALFRNADLVQVEGESPARSSAVLFVAALPEERTVEGRDERVRGVNEVVAAISRQAAAVVTITPTGGAVEGGVLSSLRRDDNLNADVSSVDHADTASGQTAAVLALVERLRAAAAPGDRPAAGHYGTGPGADKSLPDAADLS